MTFLFNFGMVKETNDRMRIQSGERNKKSAKENERVSIRDSHRMSKYSCANIFSILSHGFHDSTVEKQNREETKI